MAKAKSDTKELEECFVIMPILDGEGYQHFLHVYKNLIGPACVAAGYKPIRGDEVAEANLIHADILKRILEAPMAVCDLSTCNPNVMFELGLRQAFDKPVVLIQEKGTPKIFDIAPIRAMNYSRDMRYHDVLAEQEELKNKIVATADAAKDSNNTNSIVKLLALHKAEIPNVESNRESLTLSYFESELREVKSLLKSLNAEQPRSRLMLPSFDSENLDDIESKIEAILRSRLAISSQLRALRNQRDRLISLPAHFASHKKFEVLLKLLDEKISEFEVPF